MKKINAFDKTYLCLNDLHLIFSRVKTILVFICIILISCANPLEPVDIEEEERVKSELQDRSFRQFAPSKDALKRKGVILDFSDNERQKISLWSQYAEGDTALNEWEITAKEYRVQKSGSEYRLFFESPNSHQILPNQCDDCIDAEGVSLSIRNLYNDEKIEFKINDPDERLPIPFPVFNTWTKFSEDVYYD